MNLALIQPRVSVQEYLDGEKTSDVRHEYLAGQVHAMAGAGESHNRIALNIAFHLRAATRGKPCGVFINDMKLRVAHADSFYYPDVLVTCDPQDTEPFYKQFPCLIVEVLSPSTEAIDRREKLAAYRALPSMHHYLLVSQDQRHVEWHHRDVHDRWIMAAMDGEGLIDLACHALQVSVSMNEIYEDVVL
jgi:Uma2 family endonuclease